MITFQPQPNIPLGTYRHYKGGKYEVIALACDEETHEWRVIYKALYKTGDYPKVWDRKAEVFLSSVEVGGKHVPRFERIDKS